MIRPANPEDAVTLKHIAEAAYGGYTSHIGREPAPMVADFDAHVARDEALIIENGSGAQGFIVQFPKDDGWFVENVAIDPAHQGQGLGKALMSFAEAEARARGLKRVFLYTNVKMTENLLFYARLGYAETHRVTEDGFQRVYMEKRLK
ncbi:MAG: GNAT family N-acetyltransferase [Rhodospirillaceae bacterium]|nr:GNAT family N-acetyltransferase [Rhodospirillaceae bacterium]